MKRVLVLVLLALPRLARADASAEVTAAFAAFIADVAANKAPAVELFIPPGHTDTDDAHQYSTAVPSDLTETRAMIASAKLKTAKVVVSKGGKSAWIAGELAGRIERKSKQRAEPIRVSAFLSKDDKGWHVQATHWSTGEPDQPSDGCGMRDDWKLHASVSKDAQPIVKTVFDALATSYVLGQGQTFDTAKFGRILSDDPNAYAIGSAPKEIFIGGAKIKTVFKKWAIQAIADDDHTYPVHAAIGPDGDMMWIALGVIGPPSVCVSYRTLFVLAKESAGWRVVHQHYSQATNPY